MKTIKQVARKAAEAIAESMSPGDDEHWVSKAAEVIEYHIKELIPNLGKKELDPYWLGERDGQSTDTDHRQ